MNNENEMMLVTDKNFDERAYLSSNPDVAEAVKAGVIPSGKIHFEWYGRDEKRKMWHTLVEEKQHHSDGQYDRDDGQYDYDKHFLRRDVPAPAIVSHQKWQQYLYGVGNKKGMKILEIGSREVTFESEARKAFGDAEYVGFDFLPGRNVDVVGDVHKLATYFDENEKFDIIYSTACFEHFAMPWVAAIEIAKLLKVGGLVFIETHFSFASHERPWHFFQFSDMGLKTLFSKALGFECIDAGMDNPMVGRFSLFADEYLRNRPVKGLYCHSAYLGKKVRDVNDFKWEQVDLDDVVGQTSYPVTKKPWDYPEK